MVEARTIKRMLQRDLASFSALDQYERFEPVVCLILTAFIALIISVTLFHLGSRTLTLLLSDAIDPRTKPHSRRSSVWS